MRSVGPTVIDLPVGKAGGTPTWLLRAKPVVISILAFAAVHYVLQTLTFLLRFPPMQRTPIWTLGGLLLGVMIATPPATWWRYSIGLCLGMATSHWNDRAVSFLPGLLLAVPFLWLAAAASAWAVRRAEGGPPYLRSPRSLLALLIGSGLLVPLALALPTVLIRWFERRQGLADIGFRTWALAAVGTPLAAPLAAFVLSDLRRVIRASTVRRVAEVALLVAALSGVTWLTYGRPAGASATPAALFAPLPLLIWAAVRFELPGICLAMCVVAVIASRHAIDGRGPFTVDSPATNVLQLQAFVLSAAVPLMYLAVVLRQQRDTGRALAASEMEAARQQAQVSALYRTAPVGLGLVDTHLRFVRVNDRLAELHGLPAADHAGRLVREVLGDLAADVEPMLRHVFDTGEPIVNAELRGTASGIVDAERDWLVSHHPLWDENGTIVGVNSVVQDITERRRAERAARQSRDALRASHDRVRDLAGRLITAQEAERARIARDLHDDVTQRLAAVSIALSVLRTRATSVTDIETALESVGGQASAAADAIRQLSHGLHPAILRHAGVAAAVRAYAAEFALAHGLHLTFEDGGIPDALPADTALCIYRVAQEALTNVARHARARHVILSLSHVSGGVELVVSDDGRGFEPAAVRGPLGLGLTSMEERMRLARGTLILDSGPGRGTRVRAWVPIDGDHGIEEDSHVATDRIGGR